jgi:hypothetical protein
MEHNQQLGRCPRDRCVGRKRSVPSEQATSVVQALMRNSLSVLAISSLTLVIFLSLSPFCISLLDPSLSLLTPQLNSSAIPSLVILGIAKGGTTDLWDLLHNYHRGFQSYSYSSTSSRSTPPHKSLVHPWKELDFFSFHSSTNICSDLVHCSIENIKTFLSCPTSIFQNSLHSHSPLKESNQTPTHLLHAPPHPLHLLELCSHEILHRKIIPSLYSATASPSLIFSAPSASKVLMKFYEVTKAAPLFLVLFRHPIDWVVSMYNHGMVASPFLFFSSLTLTLPLSGPNQRQGLLPPS